MRSLLLASSLAYMHALPWEGQGRAEASLVAYRTEWRAPRPAPAWLALLVEPKAGYIHSPESDPMAGIALGIRLEGPRGLRFEAGGGPMWVDSARVTSPINFELFAGPALYLRLDSRWSAFVGYRYQHVSNGGLRMPNPGTDSHVPFAGLAWR